MSYTPIKPDINILPPYKKGSNIIIATKDINIENNQGIIIYGYIPDTILYSSVSTNDESKILLNNDICVIITRSNEVKNSLVKEFKDVENIWLCPKNIKNKIIIKCVTDEKSEPPSLYFRLYTTNIKSNIITIPKSKLISNNNENKLLDKNIYINSIKNAVEKIYKIVKIVNIYNFPMLGDDSLNFISEFIELKEDQIIGISCVDHAKTKCAHTSTINIVDNEDNIVNTWLTGSIVISDKQHSKGVTTNFLRCDHKKPLRVIENIFYNFETKSAPLENQIHKMVIYILNKI
jgi:hypothetical protein